VVKAFSSGASAPIQLIAALALYEVKLILATPLRQHRLALAPGCDRPLPPRRRGFILGPSRPVRLRVLQA
jgi:hypothetical protein